MIKLFSADNAEVGSGGSAVVYTSAPVSHPVKVGSAYGYYVINHNLGRSPDIVRMYILLGGIWTQTIDMWEGATNAYYNSYTLDANATTDNSVSIYVYRVLSTTATLKFKCYLLHDVEVL